MKFKIDRIKSVHWFTRKTVQSPAALTQGTKKDWEMLTLGSFSVKQVATLYPTGLTFPALEGENIDHFRV